MSAYLKRSFKQKIQSLFGKQKCWISPTKNISIFLLKHSRVPCISKRWLKKFSKKGRVLVIFCISHNASLLSENRSNKTHAPPTSPQKQILGLDGLTKYFQENECNIQTPEHMQGGRNLLTDSCSSVVRALDWETGDPVIKSPQGLFSWSSHLIIGIWLNSCGNWELV